MSIKASELVHRFFDSPKHVDSPQVPGETHRHANRQMHLMEAARAKTSFDPSKLACIIYGSEEALRQRHSAMERVEAAVRDADSQTIPRLYGNLDRKALYHHGLSWGKAMLQDGMQHKHGQFDILTHKYLLFNTSPFGLHSSMFIMTLKLQASPEQLRKWLPLAESAKILGTYCQTELGHGTFVRGLETTATYDFSTDEIVIHSPTVSSTKYWPGGLGYSCSHAIVMARLIVGSRDHGVHPFMVQLRSLKDWKPLGGIELGDIGLKLGVNSADNGYAIFHSVRIPRENMLMGNAQLARDGTYTKAPHDKLSYATMIEARNRIVHAMSFILAQAVTIATRYSVVREQGVGSSDSPQEVAIISYKSQHYRLLSNLSRAYAILFAGKRCDSVYQELVDRQRRGDHSTLPYGHITTAALKAYASQLTGDGAEDARKCCGGHGYSSLSGLPEIVTNVTPVATLEGENYVMYQQCARYLVKCAKAVLKGLPVDEPMSYLTDGRVLANALPRHAVFTDPVIQLEAFRHRAVRMIFECEGLLRQAQESEGVPFDVAWNTHMMALISAARAHIEYFVLQSFVDHVVSVEDAPVRRVLKALCDLFALVAIESPFSIGAIGFFEDGYISPAHLCDIRSRVNVILELLLPEVIGLTDAWNFSDASLLSALGRKDGNVYETMLSWTRQVPLNMEAAANGGVDQLGFEKFIQPIIRAKL